MAGITYLRKFFFLFHTLFLSISFLNFIFHALSIEQPLTLLYCPLTLLPILISCPEGKCVEWAGVQVRKNATSVSLRFWILCRIKIQDIIWYLIFVIRRFRVLFLSEERSVLYAW